MAGEDATTAAARKYNYNRVFCAALSLTDYRHLKVASLHKGRPTANHLVVQSVMASSRHQIPFTVSAEAGLPPPPPPPKIDDRDLQGRLAGSDGLSTINTVYYFRRLC